MSLLKLSHSCCQPPWKFDLIHSSVSVFSPCTLDSWPNQEISEAQEGSYNTPGFVVWHKGIAQTFLFFIFFKWSKRPANLTHRVHPLTPCPSWVTFWNLCFLGERRDGAASKHPATWRAGRPSTGHMSSPASLKEKRGEKKKKKKPTRAKRAAVPRSFLAHGRLPLQSKIDTQAEYVV